MTKDTYDALATALMGAAVGRTFNDVIECLIDFTIALALDKAEPGTEWEIIDAVGDTLRIYAAIVIQAKRSQ